MFASRSLNRSSRRRLHSSRVEATAANSPPSGVRQPYCTRFTRLPRRRMANTLYLISQQKVVFNPRRSLHMHLSSLHRVTWAGFRRDIRSGYVTAPSKRDEDNCCVRLGNKNSHGETAGAVNRGVMSAASQIEEVPARFEPDNKRPPSAAGFKEAFDVAAGRAKPGVKKGDSCQGSSPSSACLPGEWGN